MNNKIITVDTDNAVITVNAQAAGVLSEQLEKDAQAIADAMSYVSGATFTVQVRR